MGMAIAMYITVLSIFIITCQYAWPTVFLIIPLGWVNFWYRVWILSLWLGNFSQLLGIDSNLGLV